MLTNVKHSKYKNTGILFELLVRQITSDTLSGKQTNATGILKKYFTKTELLKEYKLYKALQESQKISEAKANFLIGTLLETAQKLNRRTLRKEKYNLIKEIGEHYNLDEFFKTKLPNYKAQAALYTLIELYTTEGVGDPQQIVNNKVTLLEHLTLDKVDSDKVEADIIEEFKTYDKDLRILTYKILLEKFNGKYATFTDNQKRILQEYITSVDSTPKLKDYYNGEIQELKKEFQKLSKKVTEKVIGIKLDELLKYMNPLQKTEKVVNEHIVNLLQYHELLNELVAIDVKK